MKKQFATLFFLVTCFSQVLQSQESPEAEIYLLTCGPGTEIYSVYGHSALRVITPEAGSDIVYNWGIFDFSAPHFAWKFAQGRLDYMLGDSSYESFLDDYIYEKRWVISQKINLEESEARELLNLIAENMKPENIKYRYDFFYDNCSTRIRDLLEKAIGSKLLYPPEEPRRNLSTFRELSGEFQKGMPWLKVGIDVLLGSPCDKKATFRNRMFLPLYLQSGLSALEVRREGKMIPLLTNPVVVVDFKSPVFRQNFLTSPVFVISLVFIVLIIVTGLFRGRSFNRWLDIVIFTIFSVLAVLMIFFNFFTDHMELRWNLNIIWLNPFIIICLASLFPDRDRRSWFRIVFFLAAGFMVFNMLIPQQINNAFIPIAGILILRSSIRAGFKWNPLTLPYLTEF